MPGPAGPAPGRGASAADLLKSSSWRESYNPLRGLTVALAVARLEAARRGDHPELQWVYREIEGADETLLALIERRTAALKELDDEVKRPPDDDLPAAVSPAQADEQVAYLKAVHARVANHRAAVEHLALAKFRGFGHVQFQLGEGDARRLALPADIAASDEPVTWVPVDPWNVTRDGLRGDWFFNAAAQAGATAASLGDAHRLDERALLVRECPRPINRVALFAFLRKTMAEKDWDGFVEIFGIPQAIIILPPGVQDDVKGAEYVTAAASANTGGGGVLAHGSEVRYPAAAMNTPPFRDHIRWQQEKVVLAGTGGLLTMLSEAGSGTLAGSAHADTFAQIARAEALELSELINRGFDEPLLRAKFPGQSPVAYWQLCADEQSDTGKVAAEIKLLSDAGYQVDPEQVSERTSYEVTLKPPLSAERGAWNAEPGKFTNRGEGFDPSQPRADDGEWSGGGGGGAKAGGGKFGAAGKLKESKGRAFNGQTVETKVKLTKQEAGALGEAAVLAHLHAQGLTDAHALNTRQPNFPVDLVQNHDAIEVKTGLVSNGKSAQQWRATIGQPGKAETAWLKTASPEAKAAHNEKKQRAILDRKQAALKSISKEMGRKVSGQTIATIINPDTRTVDIYRFAGFHLRIPWNSPAAQKAYVTSYKF